MQNILTIILISSLLFPQKIFESFDYNSNHSFVGINSYEFTVDEDGKENRTLIIKDISNYQIGQVMAVLNWGPQLGPIWELSQFRSILMTSCARPAGREWDLPKSQSTAF